MIEINCKLKYFDSDRISSFTKLKKKAGDLAIDL